MQVMYTLIDGMIEHLELPGPDEHVLPGIRWGAFDELLTRVDSIQDRKHHIALVESGKVSGRDCFSWSVTDVMDRRKDIHSKFS